MLFKYECVVKSYERIGKFRCFFCKNLRVYNGVNI